MSSSSASSKSATAFPPAFAVTGVYCCLLAHPWQIGTTSATSTADGHTLSRHWFRACTSAGQDDDERTRPRSTRPRRSRVFDQRVFAGRVLAARVHDEHVPGSKASALFALGRSASKWAMPASWRRLGTHRPRPRCPPAHHSRRVGRYWRRPRPRAREEGRDGLMVNSIDDSQHFGEQSHLFKWDAQIST